MTINEIDKEYTVEWIKTNCFSTCVFNKIKDCNGEIEEAEKCYNCLIGRGYQALKNLESDK